MFSMTRRGNTAVFLLIAVYPLLWLTILPEVAQEGEWRHAAGELLAGTAVVCMGIGLLLATRLQRLEPYFGGLDKLYVTHRWVNSAAILLLIAHFLLFMDLPPDEPGTIVGMIAYVGLLLIAIISIAPRLPVIRRYLQLPYHIWQRTHRLVGIFFALGLLHFLWVEPIVLNRAPGIYIQLFAVLGIGAYLYKQIFHRFFVRKKKYTVTAVHRHPSQVSEVVLTPSGQPLTHQAGQFMFVQFDNAQLGEAHPFTISSAPGEPALRLSIKASGDWTQRLHEQLKPGTPAQVEGPYGRFSYKQGGPKQIWLAGGIGVTPFRSWVRALNGRLDHTIHFFYTARHAPDALFWEEFDQAGSRLPTFNAHLHLSSQNGRLTAQTIQQTLGHDLNDYHVYLCGPVKLIEAALQQFQDLGIPRSQIHFEEFNFR